MRVYEFRKDLKQAFDAALRGEDVQIERGGISFSLKADGVIGTVVEGPDVGDRSYNVPSNAKPQRYCENGHRIPTGRDKCLWKGCKYS